ncbi:MAG: MoaD/ThiS family protein [Actinobacteria bacterium]|nr:MoaD/ThiS family protein [Actinomycetota bacterium]
MPTIRIPTLLRPAVGGVARVEAEGATIGEVLAGAAVLHPRFGDLVFEADGSLKRFLAVFLEGRDVRHLRGLDTPVPPGAEITILPAAAGGAR